VALIRAPHVRRAPPGTGPELRPLLYPAASSGSRMIQALKSGILILIVPPTALSVGMIFVLYHKRYQVRPADDEPKSDGW